MKITGVKELLGKLQKMAVKAQKDNCSVEVSYSTDYAVYVHENLVVYHKPPTQAKYLEQPAREKISEIAAITEVVTRKTGSLQTGLLAAGLYLQRESMKLVPVKTGRLRASAKTMLVASNPLDRFR